MIPTTAELNLYTTTNWHSVQNMYTRVNKKRIEVYKYICGATPDKLYTRPTLTKKRIARIDEAIQLMEECERLKALLDIKKKVEDFRSARVVRRIVVKGPDGYWYGPYSYNERRVTQLFNGEMPFSYHPSKRLKVKGIDDE